MKLEHVAIMINDPKEVEGFYIGILGLKREREFNINRDLAGKIFGILEEVSVFQLRHQELMMELFVQPETSEPGFRHICLSFDNRNEVIERVNQTGYECIRMERTYSDLIFIKDKSGNMFEIKESR